jgi:hypothetical protein
LGGWLTEFVARSLERVGNVDNAQGSGNAMTLFLPQEMLIRVCFWDGCGASLYIARW